MTDWRLARLEKITAARSTPDRFVKNAEGIVRGERRKKETRRVHENIRVSTRLPSLRYYFLGRKKRKIYLLSIVN